MARPREEREAAATTRKVAQTSGSVLVCLFALVPILAPIAKKRQAPKTSSPSSAPAVERSCARCSAPPLSPTSSYRPRGPSGENCLKPNVPTRSGADTCAGVTMKFGALHSSHLAILLPVCLRGSKATHRKRVWCSGLERLPRPADRCQKMPTYDGTARSQLSCKACSVHRKC